MVKKTMRRGERSSIFAVRRPEIDHQDAWPPPPPPPPTAHLLRHKLPREPQTDADSPNDQLKKSLFAVGCQGLRSLGIEQPHCLNNDKDDILVHQLKLEIGLAKPTDSTTFK